MSEHANGAKLRVLLVGPLPIEGDVIGGTKVLFAELARSFEASSRFAATIVNLSRPLRAKGVLGRAWWNLRTFARVLTTIALRASEHDVVLYNVSTRGLFASGPFVRAACRLRRTPLVVRVFGGDLAQRFDDLPSWRRALVRRTALDCDLLLVETEALAERFRDAAPTERFPNTRDLPAPRERSVTGRAPRFLFLGQVRYEKGFLHALEASDQLEGDARVDFYGPLLDGIDRAIFRAHPRARYRGVLEPHELPEVLRKHDALVFPTLYTTEGMPGVVLEAMQARLPVIASRWPAAHEMIEDGVNGLLVEVGSTESLAQAMRVLANSPELCERLSRAAGDTGDRYRHAPWHARLERRLDDLLGRSPVLAHELPQARKEVA